MISLPAVPRLRGVELLDDPAVSHDLMNRSMSDVARANALFGGRRAAIEELRPVLEKMRSSGSMLDVGTGRGDIPAAARAVAKQLGLNLWTIGFDLSLPLVKENRGSNDVVTLGNALGLPFRDKSVDIVMASQMLHHFQFSDAVAVVRELNRVARHRVIISDLRRSVFAAAGIWAASFPLGFHPVSRHDGVVSVMRGFIPNELTEIVKAATGIVPEVRHRLGFRLTALDARFVNEFISGPYELGPMPLGRPMEVVDEQVVKAPWRMIFDIAKRVEEWPAHLPHYRFVKFRKRASDGGGLVEMSADRPFGPLGWPTWWLSEMSIDEGAPAIRFRHVGGITRGMEVEWSFRVVPGGTHVTILHVWDGPPLPFIGIPAATVVIGPVFIHGIASRTLAGLARVAERESGRRTSVPQVE